MGWHGGEGSEQSQASNLRDPNLVSEYPAPGPGSRERVGSLGEGANREPEAPPPDLQRVLE